MNYCLKYSEPLDQTNIIHSLLKEKGISNPEEYINITDKYNYDPSLLSNIEKGSEIFNKHIKEKNKIFIQVDSDVDGYMSATMIYNLIKRIEPEIEIYWAVHPGKQHGINLDIIPQDVSFVIIPDAGTNDFEQQNHLTDMGIDVLILDHHNLSSGLKMEDSRAIIINNQLSPDYPNKCLSGGGVVLKFIQYLDKKNNTNYAKDFIDLAMVSIISDLMDLRDLENRWIVFEGSRNICSLTLEKFIEAQEFSIQGKITPITIGFYIAPLMNALIRVGTTEQKEILFKSFISPTMVVPSTKRGHKNELETITEQAIRNCKNAKSRQTTIKEKAVESLILKIEKNELFRSSILFLSLDGGEDFDSNLTGYVAMSIADRYKKPTIIARLSDDGYWRGSARGIEGSPIRNFRGFLLNSGLFEYAEGHDNAFGISIEQDNIADLMEYVLRNSTTSDNTENSSCFYVDLIFNGKENFYDCLYELCSYENLWGQKIEEPRVVVEHLKLFKEDVAFVGADKTTAQIALSNGVKLVLFKNENFKMLVNSMENGFELAVVGKLNLNEYYGQRTPQILIQDYDIKDNSEEF